MLSGTVDSLFQEGAIVTATLDVSGVGYEVRLVGRAMHTLRVGQKLRLYIYTHLRADGRSEGALELFGFETAWEKRVFLLLTSVNGVGFRTAVGILSAVDAPALMQSIVRDDRRMLTAVPGIGKKTAERILIELKDKAVKLMAERGRDDSSPKMGMVQAVESGDTAKGQDPVADRSIAAKAMPQAAAANATEDFYDADLWGDANQALQALGYKEAESLDALRRAYGDLQGKDITVASFIRTALVHLKTI
jgi:Holliday junction DNA helicase RuvA